MHDLTIQQPAADGSTEQLFLLFHGVGSHAQDLRGLATALAARHPRAWVVNVQSPDPSDQGQGWQWFSVKGVTSDNRPERVAATMPRFVQAVHGWQQRSGVPAGNTTLLGFSQGAIMALEATQRQPALAARVAAMAGRFAAPPRHAAKGVRIHLLHGQADTVVPTTCSVDAHAQLQALHADVTLDLIPNLGHGIDEQMAARLWARLATP
ncbi:MAG: esterase [Roseateles depolymerans]|uniref:Esterase n=1 Tax=Roseateles depolymerans TaxID=76731 RepID=A0A2W5DYR5_9BURK|nr:MAG: esterase [Roseateles depolymerans]